MLKLLLSVVIRAGIVEAVTTSTQGPSASLIDSPTAHRIVQKMSEVVWLTYENNRGTDTHLLSHILEPRIDCRVIYGTTLCIESLSRLTGKVAAVTGMP
jgi:hypothetical protein